ncbi:MAG: right-handed parallel beta-helix repeat-containing protein [Acidobacteriota bacterium]
MQRLACLTISAALLLTTATSHALDGATPVGAPTTIAQPGRYVVTTNLTNVSTVITINADRVDLDLGGHVLSTTSTTLPVIKVQSQAHVRIHSGVVRGGDEGVNVRSSSDVRLEDLQIVDSSGNGIEFWDTTGLEVVGCIVRDAGTGGIDLDGNALEFDGLLAGSQITSPGLDGIHARSSNGLRISDNSIQNAAAAGINIESTSFNLLHGNLIETAAREGVRIGLSSVMRMSSNVIRASLFDGLAITNTSDDGAVDRNVISACSRDGIDNSGSRLTFRSNLLDANGHLGMRFGAGGPDNVYRSNLARGSAAGGPACAGAVSTNDFCDEALGNSSQGDNYIPTRQ